MNIWTNVLLKQGIHDKLIKQSTAVIDLQADKMLALLQCKDKKMSTAIDPDIKKLAMKWNFYVKFEH